jgi:hypothetical protein
MLVLIFWFIFKVLFISGSANKFLQILLKNKYIFLNYCISLYVCKGLTIIYFLFKTAKRIFMSVQISLTFYQYSL